MKYVAYDEWKYYGYLVPIKDGQAPKQRRFGIPSHLRTVIRG